MPRRHSAVQRKQVWETILQARGKGTGVLFWHQRLETLGDDCQ